LIKTARIVNDSQPYFAVDFIKSVLGGDIIGKRIAVLGLSYKTDVDDLRESPAIKLIQLLTNSGALVSAYEPNKKPGMYYDIKNCETLQETTINADVIVLAVANKKFLSLTAQDFISDRKSTRLNSSH
jgi:UDP-glucose 6-dehydrogenase